MVSGNGNNLRKRKIIGIPMGLSYFIGIFDWEVFFNILGYNVEYSEKSNSKIFEIGNKYVGSDQCFPVKLYYGHIVSLLKKTQNIFIPQYTSLEKGTYSCPKIISLPYLVKNSIPFEFNLYTTELDFYDSNKAKKSVFKLAIRLSLNPLKIAKAIKYYSNSVKSYFNGDVKKEHKNKFINEKNGTIGVVGHQYALNDSVLNMDIIKRLEEFRFNVLKSDDILEYDKNDSELFNCKRPHWDFGQQIIFSINQMLKDENIKGIIFITYFGCGIDAFIEEIFKKTISSKKPYLRLTLDEHSGEAGFITRIEAFLDMIKRKEVKSSRAK